MERLLIRNLRKPDIKLSANSSRGLERSERSSYISYGCVLCDVLFIGCLGMRNDIEAILNPWTFNNGAPRMAKNAKQFGEKTTDFCRSDAEV